MKPSDIQHYIDECTIEQGQSQRFNHEECSAGEDHRARLYITRPDNNPNQYLAYCHNCGQGTAVTTGSVGYRFDGSTVSEPSVPVELTDGLIPESQLCDNYMKIPSYARGWLAKYIPEALAFQSGVRWHNGKNALAFPVVGGGYQLRSFSKGAPKYETIVPKDSLMYGESRFAFAKPPSPSNIAVLTEDYISTLCVSRLHGVNGVANLGTHCKPEAYAASPHMLNSSEIVVWFDNDSDKVKQDARTVARVIKMLYKNKPVRVVEDQTDPKHCDTTRICEVLV